MEPSILLLGRQARKLGLQQMINVSTDRRQAVLENRHLLIAFQMIRAVPESLELLFAGTH